MTLERAQSRITSQQQHRLLLKQVGLEMTLERAQSRITSQQQRRLLLKQVGLEMTLERAQSRIWCSKISWQTVSCSWSIDGEAVLTSIYMLQ